MTFIQKYCCNSDAWWKPFRDQWPKTTLFSHIPCWLGLFTCSCPIHVLGKVLYSLKFFWQEDYSAAFHCLPSLIVMSLTLSTLLRLKNNRGRKGRGKCSPDLFYFHTKVTEKHSFHCLIPQAHFLALNQTNRNLEAIQTSLFFGRYILVPSWQSFTYCLKYTTRYIMAFLQPWIVLQDLATYTEQ